MKVHLLTIFPKIFESFLSTSLVGKAIARGLTEITPIDIRDFAQPPHYRVDDTPYGGGAGMVLMPEPLVAAVEASKEHLPNARVVLLSANGERYTQAKAKDLSQSSELIIICGRYEGVDQRVIDLVVDLEISVGDFVLMGGEVAAMAIIESTLRLLPGTLRNSESLVVESFSSDLLEGPQYTKPASYRGKNVPQVLLSGDHSKIERWRKEQAQQLTSKRRPDL